MRNVGSPAGPLSLARRLVGRPPGQASGFPAGPGAVAPGADRLPEVRRSGGHGKSELGAAAGGPLHRDRPTVRLDQALDDVQAKTCPTTALRAPELPEDPRHESRGDAIALVAHGYHDSTGTSGPGGRRCSVRADPGPGADGLDRLHHNRHGSSAVTYRVLDEVAEDLVHLVRVQPGLRQVRRGLAPEPVRR